MSVADMTTFPTWVHFCLFCFSFASFQLYFICVALNYIYRRVRVLEQKKLKNEKRTIFKATNVFLKSVIPSPGDAILLLPAFWKDTVGMRVKLNAVTLVMVPSVFLVWVGKL